MLQSIPCYPECKTVGKILLDHPLSYALTANADVLVVYLQQFWRTVSKVPAPEDTIKFMLNTQEFIYTMDMFREILHLPMETPDNPLVTPVNNETIEAFMNKVFNHSLTTRTYGHDQTKINILQLFHDVINQTNVDYVAILWWDFMNNVKQKKEAIQEDYHSIKDDIPLVSVYTTRDVHVRGMQIPDAFLTEEIHATDDFKESTPRAHRTPTLNTSPQGKKRKQSAGESTKVQEKVAEEEIEKMVKGDEDEESYASEFADSVLNDDVNDSGTRLEPGSHKENPEKETDKVVKEKDIVDDMMGINKDREVDPINAQEMIAKEFVTNGPKMIEELFRKHMQNTNLNLYPITSTSTAAKSSTDLQHQLYLNVKSKHQDQESDLEIWES
nr:hypothetical protein [Tanacetum cinerariifolium]